MAHRQRHRPRRADRPGASPRRGLDAPHRAARRRPGGDARRARHRLRDRCPVRRRRPGRRRDHRRHRRAPDGRRRRHPAALAPADRAAAAIPALRIDGAPQVERAATARPRGVPAAAGRRGRRTDARPSAAPSSVHPRSRRSTMPAGGARRHPPGIGTRSSGPEGRSQTPCSTRTRATPTRRSRSLEPTRTGACLVPGCPCKDARIVSHRRAAFFARRRPPERRDRRPRHRPRPDLATAGGRGRVERRDSPDICRSIRSPRRPDLMTRSFPRLAAAAVLAAGGAHHRRLRPRHRRREGRHRRRPARRRDPPADVALLDDLVALAPFVAAFALADLVAALALAAGRSWADRLATAVATVATSIGAVAFVLVAARPRLRSRPVRAAATRRPRDHRRLHRAVRRRRSWRSPFAGTPDDVERPTAAHQLDDPRRRLTPGHRPSSPTRSEGDHSMSSQRSVRPDHPSPRDARLRGLRDRPRRLRRPRRRAGARRRPPRSTRPSGRGWSSSRSPSPSPTSSPSSAWSAPAPWSARLVGYLAAIGIGVAAYVLLVTLTGLDPFGATSSLPAARRAPRASAW